MRGVLGIARDTERIHRRKGRFGGFDRLPHARLHIIGQPFPDQRGHRNAGMDRVDPDLLRSIFERGANGQHAACRLRHMVADVRGVGHEGRHRQIVDNRPPARKPVDRRRERRRAGLDAEEQRVVIDRHDLAKVGERSRGDATMHRNAGVVDEDVKLPEDVQRRGEDRRPALFARHIMRHLEQATACLVPEMRGDRNALVDPGVSCDDALRTFSQQRLAYSHADIADPPGARDDRYLALYPAHRRKHSGEMTDSHGQACYPATPFGLAFTPRRGDAPCREARAVPGSGKRQSGHR